MTIFVDASALVAVIEEEPGGEALAARLGAAARALWSPLCFWEAVSALRSMYKRDIGLARASVTAFGEAFGLVLVTIGAPELRLALDAYEAFGKGRHPAKLNFGDCFAYACAKANGAALLYKGDDFAQTDLA